MSSDLTPISQVLPYEPAAARDVRTVGVVLLLATAALWSLGGVAVKLARMDAVAFAFWRSLSAGLVMVPLLALGTGRWPRPGWMAASVVLYTAVVGLVITSMTVSTAATGILLQYTGPVFCALFAWLFQGRRIGRRTLTAMAVAVLGIAIMVVGGWRAGNWAGPVAGLLSGVAFGGLILVLEQADRSVGGANPFAVVMLNNLGSALLMLPLCLAFGAFHDTTGRQVAIAAVTGAVQLGVPYVLFQLALRRVRPVDASLLILLEPVLNPVWVAMATAERPDGATVIGGAAVLVAMVLEAVKVQQGEAKPDAGAAPVAARAEA